VVLGGFVMGIKSQNNLSKKYEWKKVWGGKDGTDVPLWMPLITQLAEIDSKSWHHIKNEVQTRANQFDYLDFGEQND
jgi:hypothetical protein